MAAEKGSAFLLKIGNGEEPAIFSTVAGLRNGGHVRQLPTEL
jgi:predicted secreted protein